MDNHHARYGTRDPSPTYMMDKALRQSSEEYFRELFGLDDLQLQDTITSSSGHSAPVSTVNYRALYNEMKAKAKQLRCENEFLRNKLRESECQLLQITRDRTFLLERLVAYERRRVPSTDTTCSELDTSDQSIKQTHPRGSKNGRSSIAGAMKKFGN
ncbi:INO80 complex subunit E-like [Anopheles stephensi]|uniref:INO80 complex subunit E-like n=1 Tax=Anopheles stephensi TaxID=30069 RepID=UPI0016588A6A|nr:INO80 complex subunit E-like [Anopheles stephensi]